MYAAARLANDVSTLASGDSAPDRAAGKEQDRGPCPRPRRTVAIALALN